MKNSMEVPLEKPPQYGGYMMINPTPGKYTQTKL